MGRYDSETTARLRRWQFSSWDYSSYGSLDWPRAWHILPDIPGILKKPTGPITHCLHHEGTRNWQVYSYVVLPQPHDAWAYERDQIALEQEAFDNFIASHPFEVP